jgi:hypothetical protein
MSERAPERGGGDRGEEEARVSLARSESTMDATGICRFRREMSTAWRRLRLREERGKAEGVVSYL